MDLLTQLCLSWASRGAETKTAALQELFCVFFYLAPAVSLSGGRGGTKGSAAAQVLGHCPSLLCSQEGELLV